MSTDRTRIPPNAKRLVGALRSIGYSFEQAVADIIDNSIAAEAHSIHVQVVRSEDELTGVRIVDDGGGMNRSQLAEAMRFGAETEQTPQSLGKFGMGMKIASLSQATSLTVASRKGGEANAMRWTVEGLADDWRCDRLKQTEAARLLDECHADLDLREHGTVVSWSDLDRIKGARGGVDVTIDRLTNKLRHHLGLHLHRFLENERLRIQIDVMHEGDGKCGVTRRVDCLDPFGYDPHESRFPIRTFLVELPGIGRLDLQAHIWPANATSRNYKLDDAAKRQGIYFYRNDRLIQAGGWNGLRTAAEPHLSLARVMVDLPPQYDSGFSLDVQKASVKVPPSFVDALHKSTDRTGFRFKQYLNEAQKIYRRKERQDPTSYPLVPGSGIASADREKLKALLAPGENRTREVGFEWSEIDEGRLFRLDSTRKVIQLNKQYRKRILEGRPASATDAPLVKMLLFFLFREDLDRERRNEKHEARLEQIDAALRIAMKRIEE